MLKLDAPNKISAVVKAVYLKLLYITYMKPTDYRLLIVYQIKDLFV